MAKANKDGWIRHRGGKCPVAYGVLVEYRMRDGSAGNGVAGVERLRWTHVGCLGDIMAYRIHKPEEKAKRSEIVEQIKGECAALVDTANSLKQDGPLEWRDRIRQIDAEEAKRNEEHRKAIETLEEERLSLVQKLEGEGFKLIEAKPACDGMPAQDMSFPGNWKKGDLIAFVRDMESRCFTAGKKYVFDGIDNSGNAWVVTDDEGDPNGWDVEYFKWHSRP